MNVPINPLRGEVWYVDMEPTRGAELKKVRPCVVLSIPESGRLPLRLVAPLTGWQEAFAGRVWMVKVMLAVGTGLTKESAADVLQMRSCDLSRFEATGPVGRLPDTVMEEIAGSVAVTVGFK